MADIGSNGREQMRMRIFIWRRKEEKYAKRVMVCASCMLNMSLRPPLFEVREPKEREGIRILIYRVGVASVEVEFVGKEFRDN